MGKVNSQTMIINVYNSWNKVDSQNYVKKIKNAYHSKQFKIYYIIEIHTKKLSSMNIFIAESKGLLINNTE